MGDENQYKEERKASHSGQLAFHLTGAPGRCVNEIDDNPVNTESLKSKKSDGGSKANSQ